MSRTRRTIALTIALAVFAFPLFAQVADSTADHLGIFGPVLDKFWPVIVTFLTSLATKGVALVSDRFQAASQPVKWVVLYFFALAFNQLSGWLGIVTLDPIMPVLGLSLVQTVAAALVYKLGGHKVPPVAPSFAR